MLGGYDNLPSPPNFRGWDSILFTDQEISNTRWTKVIQIESTDRPDIKSRDYKWRSHIHLPEYDLVCYFDANMILRREPPNQPFRIKHFKRENVRQECDALNNLLHRCTIDSVEDQWSYFVSQGFPDKSNLWLNGFQCRDNRDSKEIELSEMVWDLCNKFTPRDQLALPFAMWKLGYKTNRVEGKHFYFSTIRMINHKQLKPKLHGQLIEPPIKKTVNVHYITPAKSDKNYGKAINDLVRNIPENDWICLRDIDTLPVDHVSFIKQCEVIASENKADLISCMTGRLGLKYQLLDSKFSDNDSIDVEVKKGKYLASKFVNEIELINDTVADIMMLFPKWLWTKAGGFKEGGILINGSMLDYHFCMDCKKVGARIGIAKGIYLFHLYRWGKSRKEKSHLLKNNQ